MTTLADVAAGYLPVVLAAVRREYPNAPRHVTTGPDDRPTPSQAHPAFYGCFDWHSAVEMHWAASRLASAMDAAARAEVDRLFDEHLTVARLGVEADYLRADPSFERPYGWGWLLALADEVAGLAHPRWAEALAPLADVIVGHLIAWLPRQPLPNRQGTHLNSAFALLRAWPWAVRLAGAGAPALQRAIVEAAHRWFAADRDYPIGWEPSATDFLSAGLAEADLMARVLPAGEYQAWLRSFLPALTSGQVASLLAPVLGVDTADGQAAHLLGLNLHRAAALRTVSSALGGPAVLEESIGAHLEASLPHVIGAGWMAEHWLAAYAVLALEPSPPPRP